MKTLFKNLAVLLLFSIYLPLLMGRIVNNVIAKILNNKLSETWMYEMTVDISCWVEEKFL